MFKYESNNLIPFLAHSYPLWIKIFLLIILTSMLLFVPYFIIYEAPIHLSIRKKIQMAEKLFYKKEYLQAINAYSELINTYPKYTSGKKKSAEAAFYLINPNSQNDPFFYVGLSFLAGEPYEKYDLIKLEKCLPGKYKQKFNDFLTIGNQK